MRSSQAEVHNALIAAMRADAGLAALVGQKVYDSVPPNAVHPYVQLYGSRIEAWRPGEDGCTVFAEIHVWTRPAVSGTPAGKIGAERIGQAIADALDNITLTLANDHVCEACRVYQVSVTRMGDGLTVRSQVNVRVDTTYRP